MALQKHILTFSNREIILPVPPSSWEVTSSNSVNTINLLNLGEVISSSLPSLKTWSISSIFPVKNYGFVGDGDLLQPYEYIELIEKYKDDAEELAYSITETNISTPCIITGFNYGEKDYSGDVFYTIDFQEYKTVTLTNTNGAEISNGYVPLQNNGNYFWSVKEGDTLLSIAKKAYGDTTKYTRIMELNGLKNPSIKKGDVLKL